MLEIEQQIHDALPSPSRQARFRWLVDARADFARLSAESTCLTGSVEHLALDRQVVLYERAIAAVTRNPALAAALMSAFIVRDAELMHVRGYPPAGFSCHVCKDGTFGLSAMLAQRMLARLPDETP